MLNFLAGISAVLGIGSLFNQKRLDAKNEEIVKEHINIQDRITFASEHDRNLYDIVDLNVRRNPKYARDAAALMRDPSVCDRVFSHYGIEPVRRKD